MNKVAVIVIIFTLFPALTLAQNDLNQQLLLRGLRDQGIQEQNQQFQQQQQFQHWQAQQPYYQSAPDYYFPGYPNYPHYQLRRPMPGQPPDLENDDDDDD